MALTVGQMQILKIDITITRASAVYLGQTLLQWWSGGADGILAAFYNQQAASLIQLWKPAVLTDALVNALVMSEFLSLTVARQNGWFVMTQPATVDATQARVRQNFVDIFGGAATTTANLVTASQKAATYLESLFTSVAGTAFTSPIFGETATATLIADVRGV